MITKILFCTIVVTLIIASEITGFTAIKSAIDFKDLGDAFLGLMFILTPIFVLAYILGI